MRISRPSQMTARTLLAPHSLPTRRTAAHGTQLGKRPADGSLPDADLLRGSVGGQTVHQHETAGLGRRPVRDHAGGGQGEGEVGGGHGLGRNVDGFGRVHRERARPGKGDGVVLHRGLFGGERHRAPVGMLGGHDVVGFARQVLADHGEDVHGNSFSVVAMLPRRAGARGLGGDVQVEFNCAVFCIPPRRFRAAFANVTRAVGGNMYSVIANWLSSAKGYKHSMRFFNNVPFPVV